MKPHPVPVAFAVRSRRADHGLSVMPQTNIASANAAKTAAAMTNHQALSHRCTRRKDAERRYGSLTRRPAPAGEPAPDIDAPSSPRAPSAVRRRPRFAEICDGA
jgi:hypothetical protein